MEKVYEDILKKAPVQTKIRADEVELINVEQIGHMVYGDSGRGWQCSVNITKGSYDCTCPAFWNQRDKSLYVDIPEVEKVPCKHLVALARKVNQVR